MYFNYKVTMKRDRRSRGGRSAKTDRPKRSEAAQSPHIVSGCIGIIKSSQQSTLNHSVFRPRINSQ
ncbi:hypothetical protein [Tychonema sp. LEGE 07203]|uniref:hypothetical protein n=1 Tax=Tychonema sp. LEGE 07203 TaxID=1828671 RepID=UPI0019FC1E69|nr:hypothetical protein [Tychonema sp. LEGE 07203]MBE9097196.1 hypothetical protein [Tychonema sp. LEGE 07203]